MVVLLVVHLLQVLCAGAYRTPRELNWWFGLALMALTLCFGLVGYLLPWDQKGYWATKVATSILGGTPVLGPSLQRAVVGGTEYGNATLTRFYGLHVGILPIALVLCLVIHVALYRRHGITAPRHATGVGHFWPEQVFRDMVAALAVFGILVCVVVYRHGAPLDAPADPTDAVYPARPEWYFLALYQMLKYFPGKYELVGTIIIPGTILAVLLILPLFDRILPPRLAHMLACIFVFALLGGAGLLAVTALRDDARDRAFHAARRQADQARDRALQLASTPSIGIPPDGARYILLRDPLYHGRAVLRAKCLGCHRYQGEEPLDSDERGQETPGPQKAADLTSFGTRAWVRGLLEDPRSAAYFGKVPQCRGMTRWKQTSKLSTKQLDDIADFVSGFASVPSDTTPAEWVADPKVADHPGRKPFVKECGQCHVVPGLTEGGREDAPGLFAWGSPQWIDRMIKRPGAPDLYGFLEPSDQMVPFGDQLTDTDLTSLARFLRGDYLPPPARPVEPSLARASAR
jgi:ubiquinol-cytochrome c reductase cytochrome b subunit